MSDVVLEVIYRVEFRGDPPVGTVVFSGAACETLTGHSLDAVTADPQLWMSAVHPDDRDALTNSTTQLLMSGAPETRTYRVRHRETGAYQHVSDTIIATTDAAGHVIGYQGTVRGVGHRQSGNL